MEESYKFSEELQPLVKEALCSISKQGGHNSLTPECCAELQQSRPSVNSEVAAVDSELRPPLFERGLAVLGGYPQYPLYKRLSLSLAYWMVTGKCPVDDLPVMYMLNEGSTQLERQLKMDEVGSKIGGRHSLWDTWSEDEKKFTIELAIKELDLRGVLDLLGVRCTVGSADILPPSQEALMATFTSPHSPSARLTVGGRALSKHSHRDMSDNWWGVCTGTEADKNKHALTIALKILKAATWINIHGLPGDVNVVEMRTIEGYGVRWKYDGSEFRGFLEPQMIDGHTVGWRH